MRVLILGATGMLGSAVFRLFNNDAAFEVMGTLRSPAALKNYPEQYKARLLPGVDVLDQDALIRVLEVFRPDIVINCVGLIKQIAEANNPLTVLPINAMLPHRLSRLCALAGARLIHVSTDCVFTGRKGGYVEDDVSDAEDLYGKSKFIGELNDDLHAITLRTSIIGHELGTNFSLVDWFLSQNVMVKGYAKAIFSGLPTIELARVMKDYVVPNSKLYGLYHVSAEPIDKLSLLRYLSDIYGHKIKIIPDDKICIDRSLDSSRFRQATGYIPAEWPDLIRLMREQR